FVNGKFCKNPALVTVEDFTGLIHFQYNIGKTKAVAFCWSRKPESGLITIANSVFGSNPPISDDVLAKAFQIDKKLVDYLQAEFSTDIN
ncbi:Germin-like protein 12-1, partial [Thalictrum thalictroides]